VVACLKASASSLESFEVQHLKHLAGAGGEYEFDAVAELTVFSGARIIVLVECKRYSRPVERAELQTLWAKLQDVKAHKAMMVATCGFQQGALEYARIYGIATIALVGGTFLYETRGRGSTSDPRLSVLLPMLAGILMWFDTGNIRCRLVSAECPEALAEWLTR